tara:strand:- start:3261 stop:3608 length:348 start_codon:yes stop_codon:yes gene_type:complete
MPTTPEEALQINRVVDRYIERDKMRSLISEMFNEVGLTTKNYSLRKTLLMLRQLYDPSYMIPLVEVKRLITEYNADSYLQDVTHSEYVGFSYHEYLDFVAGTYPECNHTLSDSDT